MTSPPPPSDWFPLHLHDESDHYSALARKRADTPVECVAPFGPDGPDTRVVYRYDDVASVLADDDRFSLDVVEDRYRAVLGPSLATYTPAARRALRRVLIDRFRTDDPWLAELVEAVVAARVDAAAAAAADGHVDLVPLLAGQVPPRVVVRLLGLPEEEWSAVAALTSAAAGFLDDPRGALRAARALRARFAAHLPDRAGASRSDVLTALTTTEAGGRRLDYPEVTSSLVLLAWAGTETAVPAIVNCLNALLTHPRQAAALRGDPDLAPAAADEALRWEAPVQVTSRRVLCDTEIAGTVLPEGATVLAHLGAANHDERRFHRPGEYDPGRAGRPRHLAFGNGPHRCLGWQLARAEVAACARVLFKRFPHLRIAPGSPPPEGEVIRSPRRLLVHLH